MPSAPAATVAPPAQAPARLHLCPLTKASPPVVLSSPVSILKVLVLPAPFTPRRPKHSPGRTPRHSRSTARMRPIFRDLYTWRRGGINPFSAGRPLSHAPHGAPPLPGNTPPGPAPTWPLYQPRAHLGQVLNLDHVVVSIPPQHSLPLAGHVHVVLHRLGRHWHAPAGTARAVPSPSAPQLAMAPTPPGTPQLTVAAAGSCTGT